MLYVSKKSYFSKLLYFYSENSINGYVVLISLKKDFDS